MLRYASYGLICLSALLAGCQQQPTAVTDPTPVAVEDPPVVQTAPEPVKPMPVQPPPQEPSLRDTRVIYFAFDRSDVRREDRAVVAAHAEWLADNPNQKVRLEGHADERGSREYNIGLGERRAQAVRQALMLQGVSGGQIETLSYGEERPAVRGTGEFSWQQNRRVEIVYLP